MNKYVVHSVRNILLFTESSRVKTHSKLEVSFSGFYTNAGQMTRGTLGDKTRKTDAGRWKTSTKKQTKHQPGDGGLQIHRLLHLQWQSGGTLLLLIARGHFHTGTSSVKTHYLQRNISFPHRLNEVQLFFLHLRMVKKKKKKGPLDMPPLATSVGMSSRNVKRSSSHRRQTQKHTIQMFVG